MPNDFDGSEGKEAPRIPTSILRERIRPGDLFQSLLKRTALRKLAANASWLVADRVVRLGVGLVVNIWIARYLGPSGFGLFNYAQAIATMFSFASTLGLPDVVVRELVRLPLRQREILASAFALRIAGACLVLASCLVFVILSRPGEPTTWLVMGLLAAAQIPQAMDVIDSEYQTKGKVARIVLVRNVNFLIFSAAKVAAVMLGMGLVTFAALVALELVVVAGCMYAVAMRDGLGFHLKDISLEEMRRLLIEVAPHIVRIALIGVYLRVDQILIGRMLGDAAVGLYTAATRLIECWYLVVTAVMLAITPRLSHTFYHSPDRYDHELKLVMRVVTLGSVGFAVVLGFVAPTVIGVLYGGAFAAASSVLVIHGWATVFSSLGQTASGALVNRRLLHIGAYQAAIGAAANVAICLWAIPRFGIVGAAYAAVITQLITGLAVNALFRETRPLLRLQIRALLLR